MPLQTVDKPTLQGLLRDSIIAHPLATYLLAGLPSSLPIVEHPEVRDPDKPNWGTFWPQEWTPDLIQAGEEVAARLQARYRLDLDPPGLGTFY